MSTTREVTIWCDAPDCNEWISEGAWNTVALARRNAKAHGWTFRVGRDLCPYETGSSVQEPEHTNGGANA